MAIVWIAPHPDGYNVFRIDGDYNDANKLQKAFRAGDVYARHGTKSERWNKADVAEANRHRDVRAREQWRGESSEEFRKLLAATITSRRHLGSGRHVGPESRRRRLRRRRPRDRRPSEPGSGQHEQLRPP